MCVSSCASTPSISCGSSRFHSPGVTATTAVLRVAAGRERVRDLGRDHRDARLRQVGHRREPLDHRVQLRRLVALDDLRAGSEQGELVRREVLEERDAADDQDDGEDPTLRTLTRTTKKTTYSSPSMNIVSEHPAGESAVASVSLAFHRKSRSLKRWGMRPDSSRGPRRWPRRHRAVGPADHVRVERRAAAGRAAVGLLIAGRGTTVSREDAARRARQGSRRAAARARSRST